MKRLDGFDWFGEERPPLTEKERERSRREKREQQREEGYQRLAELCRLGEIDEAKRLAKRNPSWGYEIVDGVVTRRGFS